MAEQIIDGHAVEIPVSPWLGDHPFYLTISPYDGSGNAGIDLDETGWVTTYAEFMRVPALWQLIHKDTGATVFAMLVHDGEQPYYTAKTVGVIGSSGSNDIRAYGIGKKLRDGSVQRLWLLPNGAICGGDDVEELGIILVKQMGPR